MDPKLDRPVRRPNLVLSAPEHEQGVQSAEGSRESCEPARYVVFLKTHKAGSSTVFNILLRYAAEEGLVLALPQSPTAFQHSTATHFEPNKVLDLSAAGMRPNLVAMHMRFHREALLSLMPNETRFVTIMRQPVDLFRSLYDYYALQRIFGGESLERFVSNEELVGTLRQRRFSGNLGFNQIAFDLGLDPEDFNSTSKVTELMSMMDSTFHLVMIAERFSESLALLRRLLCLPGYRSVVAFRKNALHNRTTLTAPVAARLAQLNAVDTLLYDHFARKFDQQVAAVGRARVAAEAAHIEALTERWLAHCVETTKGRRVVGHQLRAGMDHDETCHRLALPELEFTKELRWLQTRLARQRTGFFYQ
ncbi:galactosylceramide sulfotransferase-like [Amblyomma americanum]